MSFSQDIQSYIKETFDDVSDLSAQEQQDTADARRIAELIVTEVINSRETLGELRSKGFENLVAAHPDLISDCLDEDFTRKLIDAVSGYVARTLQLSPMDAVRIPSEVTNSYIREATRTYIFGLPQASIALCRAALEQGLKERLDYQLSGKRITFQELIQEARRCHLLDCVMERIAREVANTADDVLHEKPTDISKAREILDKLRGVLQHIYSTEGHY